MKSSCSSSSLKLRLLEDADSSISSYMESILRAQIHPFEDNFGKVLDETKQNVSWGHNLDKTCFGKDGFFIILED